MAKPSVARAAQIVDQLGIALVYPIADRPELRSLWSELYPKSKMVWSWDSDADPRVAEIWHLREKLAHTDDVAYAKWLRGRATFFSLPIFHAILGRLDARGDVFAALPREALEILELLRESSPLSVKEIRAATDLRGKENEAVFQHAMKALWARLLVVGRGEVPDGAFPSLAVGATELLYEDLWLTRNEVPAEHDEALAALLERVPAYARQLRHSLAAVAK